MKKQASIICLIIALSIIMIESCTKFKHEKHEVLKPCEYCHLADSIEGIYTGRLIDRRFTGYAGGVEHYDTLIDSIISIEVTRTFEGLNSLEDSIVFKFKTSYLYDEIYFSENSIQEGEFFPKKFTTQKFTNQDILKLRRVSVISNKYMYVKYTSLEFDGEKEP